jgi:Holliday junction resolvasome RuvABC endonuclease subunit
MGTVGTPTIYLGIDPSYKNIGYAVMRLTSGNRHTGKKPLKIIKYGVIHPELNYIIRACGAEHQKYAAYMQMADDLIAICHREEVKEVVIEAAYAHLVSKEMLMTIEARAVVYAALAVDMRVHRVHTYSALSVKKYMLGSSRNKTKKQMKDAVKSLYKIEGKLEDHEADAIALITAYANKGDE